MTLARAAFAALVLAVPLAGCGKVGPPRQPGPREVITYPRVYPAPDRPQPPPQTGAAETPVLTQPTR